MLCVNIFTGWVDLDPIAIVDEPERASNGCESPGDAQWSYMYTDSAHSERTRAWVHVPTAQAGAVSVA